MQKSETLLQRLKRESSAAKIRQWSTESRNWFVSSVKSLADPFGQVQYGARATKNIKGTLSPGYMYLFRYDPKTKDKLPYYDVHPLILVLDVDADGFLALNLHYLPLNFRTVLVSRLLEFARNRGSSPANTYLNTSYKILNASSKHRYFKPCVKRYLYSHIMSPIAKIPFDQWESAVFLPLASFKKSTEQVVWRDTRRQLI